MSTYLRRVLAELGAADRFGLAAVVHHSIGVMSSPADASTIGSITDHREGKH